MKTYNELILKLMKRMLLLVALTMTIQKAEAQAYTKGGYGQLYWDWRPDIADSCYEFTFINYMPDFEMFVNNCQKVNLFYWDDCNYGKNYINVNWSSGTTTNSPLHDTLFLIPPISGIADTFCGFTSFPLPPNFAQVMTPERRHVIYKGLIYLPEKCKNWHFAIGYLNNICGGYSNKLILYNNSIGTGPTPYTNTLSNIDSLCFDIYYQQIFSSGNSTRGFYGCSFNNLEFPDNSSPRFLSAPMYTYQIQKDVEYNPGPYDPDHDDVVVTITDTLRETVKLNSAGTGAGGFDIFSFSKTDIFGNPFDELNTRNLFYAPLPGQTGPNPLRYTPQNPFNTDSTFLLKSQTGKTTFKAKTIMEPVLYYSAKDYRNNRFVSESYCVNQFTILADGRLPSYIRIDTPSVQGILSYNSEGYLLGCAGTPISFDAYVKLPGGPSGNLIVSTTADTTLPGNGACSLTGMNTDSVHMQFSWTPPANARGLYNVFISAKDSNCNAPYHHYTQVYTWSFFIDSCVVPNGILDIEKEGNLVLYPNPAKDEVTIKTSEVFSSIRVYNLLSQKLIERKIQPSKSIEINTKDLPRGIYLVNIDGKYIRKLGIEK